MEKDFMSNVTTVVREPQKKQRQKKQWLFGIGEQKMETEKKLIYVDDAKRTIEHFDPAFAGCIDNIPTVDAVEVVHASWIYECRNRIRCPICGMSCNVDSHIYKNYCGNCGANMIGGDMHE
jgi:hypothetical protein